MNKYQNGKIYKLTSKQTDNIYVGSTTKPLVQRMSGHKCDYKCTSVEMLKYDDCIIELIEDYPCDSKTELEKREQHYIDLYKDIIVNKHNATIFCEHNKHRRFCRECKGSQFCEHNKRRNRCIDCKGSQICEHNKQRRQCKICNNVKICIAICRDKNPCKNRAKQDSDYCGWHTPK
jgi:hypothetical protein